MNEWHDRVDKMTVTEIVEFLRDPDKGSPEFRGYLLRRVAAWMEWLFVVQLGTPGKDDTPLKDHGEVPYTQGHS